MEEKNVKIAKLGVHIESPEQKPKDTRIFNEEFRWKGKNYKLLLEVDISKVFRGNSQ